MPDCCEHDASWSKCRMRSFHYVLLKSGQQESEHVQVQDLRIQDRGLSRARTSSWVGRCTSRHLSQRISLPAYGTPDAEEPLLHSAWMHKLPAKSSHGHFV
ncbi:unnamed protein product [Effrenium voratum]|nr:unnamed protein product [Effrenium voratum]